MLREPRLELRRRVGMPGDDADVQEAICAGTSLALERRDSLGKTEQLRQPSSQPRFRGSSSHSDRRRLMTWTS